MTNQNVKTIVVTLFEKHYHYGVASLINSLYHSNFKGMVRIGYRGDLPPWVNQLEQIDANNYKLDESIIINFVLLNTEIHFGYYKPYFLQDSLTTYPEAESVYYFDPDIVVNAEWSFYTSWVDLGIALCQDNSFAFVHPNHPWRHEWKKLLGTNLPSDIAYYVNSGYIGLKRENQHVLDKWIVATEKYKDIGGDLSLFDKGGERAFKGDQDLLNAVITAYPDLNISVIGLEGMGFSQPAYLMSHAVSEIKPWKKNYLKFLLTRGKSPDFMEKDYMKFANSPISVYSEKEYKMKKINMKLSAILGRVLGRS